MSAGAELVVVPLAAPVGVGTSTIRPSSAFVATGAGAACAICGFSSVVSFASYDEMRSQTAAANPTPRTMKKTERNESFFS